MGDVVQETVTGADRVDQADRCRRIAFDQGVVLHHHLRETVGPADEHAVLVGGQQRHAEDVGIGEVDAQDVARLRLHHRPGRHATKHHVVRGAVDAVKTQVPVDDQAAGGLRFAVGVEFVGAQEHLVRRVRAVGLVLVDERRGGVGVFVDVVGRAQGAIRTGQIGGAGHHHEVGAATLDIQRVIGLQRDEHRAAAALGHQGKTVVKKLAEEGHPSIEGRRQALVGRGVRQKEGLEGCAVGPQAVHQHRTVLQHIVQAFINVQRVRVVAQDAVHPRIEGRGVRRGVAGGLVGDQVADGAGVGIDHQATGLRVRGARLGIHEVRFQQAWKGVVGGTELGLVRDQLVEGAINGSQSERHFRVRNKCHQRFPSRMPLCDQYLFQDEFQIRFDVRGHFQLLCAPATLI
ncbi:MAG: hypothetical protein A3B67_15700 [Burkholderiales bacterium RIFCSPHIGHO2_02_FULL_66_10]|nr:MAG: hypothetical protein A3B67_15700 [Burkholderiales bacterium RIFCSPHIGHO2_02_FULL_66_10]